MLVRFIMRLMDVLGGSKEKGLEYGKTNLS
jgi:hypothetical protein